MIQTHGLSFIRETLYIGDFEGISLPARKTSCKVSNTRDSVSLGYPNTEKRAENTTRSGVF